MTVEPIIAPIIVPIAFPLDSYVTLSPTNAKILGIIIAPDKPVRPRNNKRISKFFANPVQNVEIEK